jgi:translation initiation factor IF-3
VPIPRRFDRRPPERDQTRTNERIRVSEVRLIGDDGEQVGVVSRDDALKYAQERNLDLVEVAAEARPPVCRVLDYSKYKYEQEQKAKAARKHQTKVNVREMKLRPKIATNDYETKKNHVERFLRGDDKVKVTIMFRGREQSHPERGERLLRRLAEDLSEISTIDQQPTQDGRNMTMMLSPVANQPEAEGESAETPTEEAPAPKSEQKAETPAPELEEKPEKTPEEKPQAKPESEDEPAAESEDKGGTADKPAKKPAAKKPAAKRKTAA